MDKLTTIIFTPRTHVSIPAILNIRFNSRPLIGLFLEFVTESKSKPFILSKMPSPEIPDIRDTVVCLLGSPPSISSFLSFEFIKQRFSL